MHCIYSNAFCRSRYDTWSDPGGHIFAIFLFGVSTFQVILLALGEKSVNY